MRTSVYSTLTLSNITTSEPHLSAPLPTTHQPSPTLQPQFPFLVFLFPSTQPRIPKSTKATYKAESTMRLPYIPSDPKFPSPEDQAIVERVKERRGGKLLALDRALLHAPPMADGWCVSSPPSSHPLRHPIPSRPLPCPSHVIILFPFFYTSSKPGPRN